MQIKAEIRRILALVLVFAMVLGAAPSVFASDDPNWRANLGSSGIADGTIRINSFTADKESQWKIDSTDLENVVLEGVVPIVEDVLFPASLELSYRFQNETDLKVSFLKADGSWEEIKESTSYYTTHTMRFSDWEDTFSLRVEAKNRHPATYVIGIEVDEDADPGEAGDIPQLTGVTISIGDKTYQVGSAGEATGGIRSLWRSLFPFPLEKELDLHLPEDVLLSELLDATASFEFEGGVSGQVATRDGRILTEGSKLFENMTELLENISEFALFVGPVEQINPNRLKYSLSFSGGRDDISGFDSTYVRAYYGTGSYRTGNMYGDTLRFSINNHNPELEHKLSIYSYYMQSLKAESGLVSMYKGADSSGEDITAQVLAGTYPTGLKSGDLYTITLLYLGDEVTKTLPVEIRESGGGGTGTPDNMSLVWSVYDNERYNSLYSQNNWDDGNYNYYLLKNSDLDLSKLVLDFYVYANDENGYRQIDDAVVKVGDQVLTSQVSEVDFTSPVTFSIEAEDKSWTEGQHVMEKVRSGEGYLYLPLQDRQNVRFWNDGYSSYTDFTLFNIGTQELGRLGAKLKDGTTLELDSYWTVGGEKDFVPNSLRGIDLDNFSTYGNQWNKAMVRIRPKIGTEKGVYSDELIFTVGDNVVRTIYINADVLEDITGEPDGENPGGENPGGENPGGENPGGENPGGENPGGENPGGENPGGNGGGKPATPISGGSGGGKSGGKSGGGGGTNQADGNRTATTTAAKAAGSPATYEGIRNSLEQSLSQAPEGGIAILRIVNGVSISPSVMGAIADAAALQKKTVIIHADTLTADGKSVQGRLYIEPAKMRNTTGDLMLTVQTQAPYTQATRTVFESWFGNRLQVIHCAQSADFGAQLKVAARLDLSGLDTANLLVYSYNQATNAYTRVSGASYSVDSNGYLHINTQLAGDLIVTDAPLSAK